MLIFYADIVCMLDGVGGRLHIVAFTRNTHNFMFLLISIACVGMPGRNPLSLGPSTLMIICLKCSAILLLLMHASQAQ